MRRITLLLFLLFSLFVNAQLTVNNTTVTPQQLVQNVLLGSGITVTNVKFNGSTANASVSRDQAGLFNGGVSTNLGINSGVILATGKAQVAIGPNGAGSSSNPTANPLEGDPDLALLSGQTIRNVAILEFDFIPQGQNLSFQYVFASEEYPEYSASTYNDAFGFFLSGPGISGPYSGGARNIALIPSSTTAITINNVNNGTINNGPCNNCNYYVNNTTSGQNPFPGPGSSLIQYDGFTTVLTAAATVQCGQTYHIKLAIANVGDNGYDSAVFIQGGSFNVTPVNLGVDLTGGYSLCLGEVTTLNTGLPASVLHQWSFNGVIIPGATGPTLTINQNGANIPGTYTVIAYPFGPACPVSDSIDVDYFPGPTLTTPPPVSLCDNISPPLFNLNSVIPIIMNGQSISDFENYGFYLTQADAMNDVNMIPMSQWSAFPGTNGQIIYFAGENVPDGTGCRAEVHFNLIQVPCPITNPPDLTLCDDASNDGIAVFNFDPQTPIVLGSLTPSNYVVTYHTSQADANGDVNAITPTNAYSNISNPQTIYVRREEAANPSNFITSSFQLHVVAQPTVTISGSASICSGSSTNLTFTGTPNAQVNYTDGTNALQTTLNSSGTSVVSVTPTVTTTYSLVNAMITTPPGCTNPQTGIATVTVSSQVVGTLSYSPSSFCTSDLGTYSPSFSTTTAGSGSCASNVPTYTSTPSGLTINASTGVITPSTSLPGTYTVTINFPACGGCAAVGYTTTVTVASPTTSTISYTTPLCTSDTSIYVPVLTGATSATNYSATPSGLTIDATTGVITPSTSLAGTYTITYVPNGVGACATISTSTTVTITAAPTATIAYAGTPFCKDITAAQSVTLAGTNAYTGGTFTSTSGLTLDATTGAITPSTSTPGTYTVTYTIPSGGGCPAVPVTTTVTITGVPTATITYAGTPFCNDITAAQSVTLAGTNAYTGGTFTSTVGLTLDATTGAITPSTSTPGTYTVTYTIPASAGCSSVPVTTTVTITAAPTATIAYAGTPFCKDITAAQSVTLAGTNAYTGGTFTSTAGLTLDATTGAITPSTSTPGTYTVTYTIPSGGGCPAVPVTTTVTITGVPTATITYAGTPFCNDITSAQSVTLAGTNAYTGGTFTSTVGLTLDATTGAITPSTSTPGTYTVTYTIPASAGCSSVPVTTTVTITAAPTATIAYASTPFCKDITAAQSVTLAGTNAYTGGTFTSTSGLTLDATTGAITPSTSTPGTYTVTYTIPASAGCPAIPVTTTVTITGVPTATITYAGTPFCNDITAAQSVTLAGTNAYTGGTFTSTSGLTLDATTGAITPSTSTPGTYTVTYTIPASAGCSSVPVTTTVTITAAPTATIAYAGTPFCKDITAAQSVTLAGTNAYTGGTFTSTVGLTLDATTGAITPSTSTPGTYTVTYTIPASAGCPAVPVTTTVTITGVPTATITYAGTPFCNDITAAQSVTLAGTNAYTGGTFTSTSGLTLDATTGAITPSTSTPGTYTVTYTIPASAGCSSVPVTTTVTITAAPTATIAYAGTPFCNDITAAQSVTLAGTNAYTGGTFTSTSGLTLDATTGAITPSTSTPGTYTVTYTIPSGGGCPAVPVTTTVTITGVPTATITYAGTPFCNDITAAQSVTLAGTNAYTGGTFTSTSGLTLDATTGVITPSTSTPGTYTVTYTIPASAGCSSVPVTTTVTITDVPTASISVLPATICSGTTSTVTFTGTPNATVTYTVDNGVNQTIVLDGSGSATLTTPGLTNSSLYTLVSVANGCTTILNGSVTINVLPLPTAGITGSTICQNQSGTVTITGTPNATVTYTVDGGVNQTVVLPTSGVFTISTPSLTSNSTYQLVSILSATSPACSNSLTGNATVVVNPRPVAIATPVGETICSGTSTNINLSSAVSGTTFDWVVTTESGATGASAGSGSSIVQTLTATGISNGFVIYTITPIANGCSGSPITVQVNVTPRPVASYTGNLTYCDGSSTAIVLSSSIPGTTFTWNIASSNLDTAFVIPGSGNTITQTLDLLNPLNTGSVTYTVLPFANNCYGEPISIQVQVNPIPNVIVTAVDDSICSGETVHINSNSNIAGTTFNWTITNQTGAIVTGATSGSGSSIDQVITTTSPVASGTVTYQVTPVKNGCVGLPQTIVITISPRPEMFGVLPQLPICSGSSTNIVLGASLPGTTFDWVISSYSGVSGMSAGSGSVIAQILTATTSGQGSVTYAVTPSLNGCSGVTVYYTVLVNPAPKPMLTDGHICVVQATGATYQTYTLSSGVPASGHVFEWFFNGNTTPIAGATGPNYVADQAGTYTVNVRNLVTNCQGTASAVVSMIYPATAFVTSVTDAFTGNATVTVTVSQPGTGVLMYALDGGAWQESNVFSNVQSGNHTVSVVDLEGCTYLEDTVLVIDYMNYFTPNGDGYNDRWNIVGLSAQHNAKIYIFDRYGKLIKQIDPLGEGWDGKFNGQDLPSTDYWFSVDYIENEQQKQFKAHFSLKR